MTNETAGVGPDRSVGQVFQINEKHGREGWIGAFVLATEIKDWGIQGFVHLITTHDKSARAYIRLKWEEIDFIGNAKMIPADEMPADSASEQRGGT